MMCSMSELRDSAIGSPIQDDEAGVLANLPRTRPQRSSPRRAAARRAAVARASTDATGDSPADAVAAKPSKPAPRGASGKRATARRATEKRPTRRTGRLESSAAARAPVPRQGYECADDAATGPVEPPGGTELFVSAVEIVGELAKSGLFTGERLLKDAFSRLPLS